MDWGFRGFLSDWCVVGGVWIYGWSGWFNFRGLDLIVVCWDFLLLRLGLISWYFGLRVCCRLELLGIRYCGWIFRCVICVCLNFGFLGHWFRGVLVSGHSVFWVTGFLGLGVLALCVAFWVFGVGTCTLIFLWDWYNMDFSCFLTCVLGFV